MNHKHLLFALSLCALGACNKHTAVEPLKLTADIQADFKASQETLNAPQYFEVFADSANMDPDMLTALKFLYAYMPVADITDYPGEFFKENVATALKARAEMPWGKTVPAREFMHFVIPVRVNNENLDGHRQVFYDELKDRVKGMTMEEAILEVNHWCHEKATYEPSDARTHSPLATVCSGIGRCGEESTFAVAALRAIGIPARQVYTPRWAHTDDNHAWVEVWADGKWHFLGACEPEAVLDLGWFNDPAARGMLMNTRVLGKYDGPEEKLLQKPMFTDINVTENYASVDTVKVTVTDANGKPIENASVDFCLYNYAEFYPIARKTTDADGAASLVAGLGDLVIWASANDGYAVRQVSVGKEKDVAIALEPGAKAPIEFTLDIVPPPAKRMPVKVDSAMAAENLRRKAYEDSVRMAYVNTFTDKSRGNRATIDRFLQSLAPQDTARGKAMLETLTDKDWTDVTGDVLSDAMLAPSQDTPLYAKYVLSPRIEKEFLAPFREAFYAKFDPTQIEAFRTSPTTWAEWVLDSIATDLQWQPASVRMSPKTVLDLRRTNVPSRNVFFVAGARAIGIPARIDEVTYKPQYYLNGNWIDLLSSTPGAAPTKKGKLTLSYKKDGGIVDPVYYTHFTLSKIEDGMPQLMNYSEEATWSNTFAKPQEIDPGEYMLISGQRLADGGVLVLAKTFTINAGDNLTVPLALRQDSEGVKVIGNFNSEDIYYDLNADAAKSLLSTTGRGYYILCLVADGNEPSNHALRDIAARKAELEQLGTPMVVLFPDADQAKSCALTDRLPAQAAIGYDIDGKIRKELVENLYLADQLPIIVIADTFNRVVFASSGYAIGLGQSLLDTTNKIQ